MQPIQINVQVNIGLNKELQALLTPVFDNLVRANRETPAESPETAPAPKPEVENKPAAQEAKPEEQPAEDPKPAPAASKEYTEVDVRAAMDAVRRRIEGENYKEKPDSENYKKWHRALSDWFKRTSAIFGADKPSMLADSQSRAAFISCCETVRVEDGQLVEDCPF